MKPGYMRNACICLMVIVLTAAAMAGCTKDKPSETSQTAPTQSITPTAAPTQPASEVTPTDAPVQPAQETTPEPTESTGPGNTGSGISAFKAEGATYRDGFTSPAAASFTLFDEEKYRAAGYTVVTTSEDLIEAIAPGASIIIKPGYYNLSKYIDHIWAKMGEEWNALHEYVQLVKVYDGVELQIKDVNGLMISGGSEQCADTEIVLEPRYAGIFNFVDCTDVSIMNLTAGHTETGDCSGNVVNLTGCRNINMYNLDLYGCGVYGISANKGWEGINVYSSVIRDCSWGPFQIFEGLGAFSFYDCRMTGSGWCSYTATADSSLLFDHCVFGESETASLKTYRDIVANDCEWAELTYTGEVYDDVDPDFEEYYMLDDPDFVPSDFDFESMEEATGHDYLTIAPDWTAYMIVDPENGSTTYLPHFDKASDELIRYHCEFRIKDDKQVGFLTTDKSYEEFDWVSLGESSFVIFMPSGLRYYGELYRDMDAERAHTWMLLQMGKYNVWFY